MQMFPTKRFAKAQPMESSSTTRVSERVTNKNDKVVSSLTLTFKELSTKLKGVENQLPRAQLAIILSYSSKAYYTAQTVIQISTSEVVLSWTETNPAKPT